MNLERIGNITSELSSNLLRAIVLPGGIRDWFSRAQAERARDPRKPQQPDQRPDKATYMSYKVEVGGPVVLIAGSPVPDEAVVEMMHLAGGRAARVAILPIAAVDQRQCGAAALRLFTRFGMRRVEVLEPITRDFACDIEQAHTLGTFDAAFLCGPDLPTGLELLHDSALAQALGTMHRSGRLVAGMASGAVLLSERLIIVRDGRQALVPGLGIASGLVVDTESANQARLGEVARCMNAEGGLALMGAELEAGSAAVMRDGEVRVLGEGSVTFLDSRESAVASGAGSAGVYGLKVHVLQAGSGINLRSRRPFGPGKKVAAAASER